MSVTTETHHRVPRRLLTAHDRAWERKDFDGEALQLWMEYEELLSEYGLVPELSREELVEAIEASAVMGTYEEHRFQIHAADWARWGREGGLATLERYGRAWFCHLARRRWRKVTSGELARVRERLRRAREATA